MSASHEVGPTTDNRPSPSVLNSDVADMDINDADSGHHGGDEAPTQRCEPTPTSVADVTPVLPQPQYNMVISMSERIHIVMGRLFETCDADKDGHLNIHEMRDLTLYLRIPMSAERWPTEYQRICDELGAPTSPGVDQDAFQKLMYSEGGVGKFHFRTMLD